MSRYCVIDFETTGLSPQNDEVVEFAAVQVHNGEVGLHLASLCRPSKPIPYAATQIHGITNEMVWDKPSFSALLPLLLDFIGEDTVVAHNAPFDMGFLNRYCADAGIPFAPTVFCTLRAARGLFPFLPSRSLVFVAQHLGIENEDSYHRALGDAMTTARVLIKMLNA